MPQSNSKEFSEPCQSSHHDVSRSGSREEGKGKDDINPSIRRQFRKSPGATIGIEKFEWCAKIDSYLTREENRIVAGMSYGLGGSGVGGAVRRRRPQLPPIRLDIARKTSIFSREIASILRHPLKFFNFIQMSLKL
jgi:hypothetical protein